ncbi:MAG: hypothetical protein JXD23_09325 [Spirochaetales bacterium]|nr:hypothetical protein [Spirochaetales bacterium]
MRRPFFAFRPSSRPFRRFGSELAERFDEIVGVTRKAMDAAPEKRKSFAGRSGDEIRRLEDAAAKIVDIGKTLEGIAAEGRKA